MVLLAQFFKVLELVEFPSDRSVITLPVKFKAYRAVCFLEEALL